MSLSSYSMPVDSHDSNSLDELVMRSNGTLPPPLPTNNKTPAGRSTYGVATQCECGCVGKGAPASCEQNGTTPCHEDTRSGSHDVQQHRDTKLNPPPVPESQQAPGRFALMRMAYDQLVKAVIRPPRAVYMMADLGPPVMRLPNPYSDVVQRKDLQLRNWRGMRIECSHWEPHPRPDKPLPCVVFLHGNSSCRVDALQPAGHSLSCGFTMFAIDTAGSGHSEGEWVSLGWHEADDIQVAVEYLRGSGEVHVFVVC